MAHTATHFSAPGLVGAFFQKIWNGLIYIGEHSARARMAQEIAWMTDEELERAGMTRADVVKRVFCDRYYL